MSDGQKVKLYMQQNNIEGEYFEFEESCHSAEDAAKAAKTSVDNVIKNICLVDEKGNIIIALVKALDRVSTTKVGKVLGIERPRQATPEEVFEKTGFKIGGVPSFGVHAKFLIDSKIMEKGEIWTSGGSANSVMKMKTKELQRANQGMVARVRK